MQKPCGVPIVLQTTRGRAKPSMFPSVVRRRSKPVPFGEMSTEGAAAVAAQIPVPRGELCTAARR